MERIWLIQIIQIGNLEFGIGNWELGIGNGKMEMGNGNGNGK